MLWRFLWFAAVAAGTRLVRRSAAQNKENQNGNTHFLLFGEILSVTNLWATQSERTNPD